MSERRIASTNPTTIGTEPVVLETVDKASGVTVWKLHNGARVVFKQTASNPDEVIVHGFSPGGYSRLPDSLRFSTGRMIADLMTASGSTESGDRTRAAQRLSALGVRQFSVMLSGLWEEMVAVGSSRNPEIFFSTMFRQSVDSGRSFGS